MIKVREFQRKDQDAAFAIWKHGMSVDLGNYWVLILSFILSQSYSKDKMDPESASCATSDSSDASSGPPSRLRFEPSSRNILLDASIRNFHCAPALLGLQNK